MKFARQALTDHLRSRNQTLFWENLAPQSSGGGQFPSSGKLYDQVQQDFGGLDGLKKAVNTAALGIQGSGWAWLGYNPQTKKVRKISSRPPRVRFLLTRLCVARAARDGHHCQPGSAPRLRSHRRRRHVSFHGDVSTAVRSD